MRLTPWLLEAIQLLSLPKMELIGFVQRKMEDNPFLEGEIDTSMELEAPIECDLLVQRVDGICRAMVNRGGIPRARIRSSPAEVLQGPGATPRELKEAIWLVKSLARREELLLGVGQEVVALQEDFFVRGRQPLAPVTRRQVAEELRVHESTEGRVVSGKLVFAHGRSFPLGDFFGNGLRRQDMLRELQALVEAEEPSLEVLNRETCCD